MIALCRHNILNMIINTENINQKADLELIISYYYNSWVYHVNIRLIGWCLNSLSHKQQEPIIVLPSVRSLNHDNVVVFNGLDLLIKQIKKILVERITILMNYKSPTTRVMRYCDVNHCSPFIGSAITGFLNVSDHTVVYLKENSWIILALTVKMTYNHWVHYTLAIESAVL